jgi:hypothetical protein
MGSRAGWGGVLVDVMGEGVGLGVLGVILPIYL